MSTGFWIVLAAIASIFVVLALIGRNMPRVMRVFIRVDMQNDFMPYGSLPVPGGDLIVAVVNKLSRLGKRLNFFDLVIDTQDSHPEDHGSFFTQHPGMTAFSMGVLNGIQQVLWTVHCVFGTRGWEFHPDLDRSMVDKTVLKGRHKGVDSYSGFYDNGRDAAEELKKLYPFLGQSTGLAEYIIAEAQRRGATEIIIYVCGLAFRFCVSYTAKDARSLVYNGKQVRVKVIIDATKPISMAPGDVEKEIEDLKAMGIEIVTADDVVNEMHANAVPPYYPPMH